MNKLCLSDLVRTAFLTNPRRIGNPTTVHPKQEKILKLHIFLPPPPSEQVSSDRPPMTDLRMYRLLLLGHITVVYVHKKIDSSTTVFKIASSNIKKNYTSY